jgi:Tfp pilus assembly protein FimV
MPGRDTLPSAMGASEQQRGAAEAAEEPSGEDVVDPPGPVPDAPVPSTLAPAPVGDLYRVRAGDSLWSVARCLLGPDASVTEITRAVVRLWELNRDRIGTGDPGLLPVGTVLRLR